MPVRLRSSGRIATTVAALALTLVSLIPQNARAQQAQIGIYNDTSRSSCSLSDAGGGQIRAYVIVNSTNGITGVRFSAPKPACFSATWVSDETPSGFLSIGDSQTDISIATGGCKSGPQHVLTMVFQSTSTSTPCCLFQLQPAEDQASIVYTDCSFTPYPMSATNAYVNANATCPCTPGLDLPPAQAFNPYPGDHIINISPPALVLTWQATDPENDLLSYDVYLGTAANPPLVASNLTQPQYTPAPTLSYTTTYYWKVVVKDDKGNSTDGVVWRFTTGPQGVPPTPVNPTPLNGATNQYLKLTLNWQNQGGTGSILGSEVHFGTTNNPPLAGTTTGANTSFSVDSLSFDTTYYWYVVVLGEFTNVQGALWSFHTETSNSPPNVPNYPFPSQGTAGLPNDITLQWAASDPEGESLEYDLYFGKVADPPFLTHTTSAKYRVNDLDLGTSYHWRVVAIDPLNASTSGPVWGFITSHAPPTVPYLIAPGNGTTISPVRVQLKWTSGDPDGLPLTFDVYLGTTNPPPLVLSRVSQSVYYLNTDLQQGATYYWKVAAHDQDGLTTEGPLWNFNTGALIPPLAPSNPSPASGATVITRRPTLTWHCSDPEGQPLYYMVQLGIEPSSAYPVNDTTFTVPFVLAYGATYEWKVKAIDTDDVSTTGPTWTFVVGGSNLPPTVPQNAFPPDQSGVAPPGVALQWSASDPENAPLKYDVFFGTAQNTPLVASNLNQTSYSVSGLLANTNYYWRVRARDTENNTTTSPIWHFNTGLPNTKKLTLGLYPDETNSPCVLQDVIPGGRRTVHVVLDGPSQYTGVRFDATKPPCWQATWLFDTTPYQVLGNSQSDVSVAFGECLSPPVQVMTITYQTMATTFGCCDYVLKTPAVTGRLEVTDCAFTDLEALPLPVLGISSDFSCSSCVADAGGLSFAAGEDTCRAGGPDEVTADLKLTAGKDVDTGGIDIVLDPALTFVSCERGEMIQDWPTFSYQVHDNVITINAAGPVIPQGTVGSFARIKLTTNCCTWQAPAELGLADATGDLSQHHLAGLFLACRYPPSGDVNNDGNITVGDAQCALQAYLYAPLDPPGGCGGASAAMRADVDCSGFVTPGDAQCIFRNWLDQSCSFCNGTPAERATRGPAPQLSLRALRENDDIVVVLHANGVQSIGAFGFELKYPAGITFVRVEPPRKDTFAALQTRPIEIGRVRVGAYVNSGKDFASNGDILAMRFHAADADARGVVTLQEFVDDLSGAAQASVSLEGASFTTTPTQVVLHQNSPNPFNPRTMIRFELPQTMRVRLSIFDVHGRLVRELLDEQRDAGSSMVVWDGTDNRGRGVATGVYFYVLTAGGTRYQHKMVMLK